MLLSYNLYLNESKKSQANYPTFRIDTKELKDLMDELPRNKLQLNHTMEKFRKPIEIQY